MNQELTMINGEPQNQGSMFKGLFICVLLHGLQLMFAAFVLGWLYIGLTQLVYVIPAVIVAYKDGEPKTARGILMGAVITIVFNASCHVLTMGPGRGMPDLD